ncbi:MAG: wax ester/triacylglycerol synthase family O-acyltransferase [Thermoleophilaceae bacterium]
MGPRVPHAREEAHETSLTGPVALSPADLSAIQAEQGPVHMHVAGVLVFGGRVAPATIARRIEERIHLVPHYRMRLAPSAPLGLSQPVWEEDPDFSAARHVRAVRWPAPGDDAALAAVVGPAMSERLDRERPLWELLVVDSAETGRTAVVAKMHHALVDGIAAIGVATVILDPTPEPLDLPPPAGDVEERRRTWVAELAALMPQLDLQRRLGAMEPLLPRVPADVAPGPRELRALAAAVGVPGRRELRRLATAQLDVPRRLAGGGGRGLVVAAGGVSPRRAQRRLTDALDTLRELSRARPQAPDTRINAAIGPERAFAVARADLEVVKAIRRAAGASVNDVLLAAVALMLEEYLGDDPPETAIALVPVSTRDTTGDSELGNRISTVFIDLPLRGEPLDRVRAIAASTRELRGSAQVRAGAFVVGAAGLAPPIVASLTARALGAPRLFNLVVSNVPGPQQTFYLDGVPLREVFPAVPLNPRNQALSIGMLSYDGGVGFGLLADRDALPDVADAAAGLERALAGLAAAAGA